MIFSTENLDFSFAPTQVFLIPFWWNENFHLICLSLPRGSLRTRVIENKFSIFLATNSWNTTKVMCVFRWNKSLKIDILLYTIWFPPFSTPFSSFLFKSLYKSAYVGSRRALLRRYKARFHLSNQSKNHFDIDSFCLLITFHLVKLAWSYFISNTFDSNNV